MKHEVFGPLAVWTLFFIIASAIRYATFDDSAFWIQIPPELTLWATGILFSLSVSENTYYQARLTPRTRRNPSGTGFTVDYDITLPDQPGFTAKFMYLFLFALAIWILCLLMAGSAQAAFSAITFSLNDLLLPIVPAFLLASTVVATTLRALYDVTR